MRCIEVMKHIHDLITLSLWEKDMKRRANKKIIINTIHNSSQRLKATLYVKGFWCVILVWCRIDLPNLKKKLWSAAFTLEFLPFNSVIPLPFDIFYVWCGEIKDAWQHFILWNKNLSSSDTFYYTNSNHSQPQYDFILFSRYLLFSRLASNLGLYSFQTLIKRFTSSPRVLLKCHYNLYWRFQLTILKDSAWVCIRWLWWRRT